MRLIFVILCFFSSSAVIGQTEEKVRAALSVEIVPIITDGDIRLGFSHSFSERWSAEGMASIGFRRRSSGMTEEDMHEEMLEDSGVLTTADIHPEFRIGFRFWASRPFHGPYAILYCLHSRRTGTDMTIGFGYAFSIWKCLVVTAGYETSIRESIKRGSFGPEGISLGINYIF